MSTYPDCPACGRDAGVTATTEGNTVTYRCMATYAHEDGKPSIWTTSLRKSTRSSTAGGTSAPGGVTADLVAPLLSIVQSLPKAWIEHGVIEYELRVRYPAVFGAHVGARGHFLVDGAKSRSTASGVRFATALRRLESSGDITHVNLKPTGAAWAHDTAVGFWATEPAPDRDQLLTWEQYAVETLGRPDGAWTDEDRATVQQLATEHGPKDAAAPAAPAAATPTPEPEPEAQAQAVAVAVAEAEAVELTGEPVAAPASS